MSSFTYPVPIESIAAALNEEAYRLYLMAWDAWMERNAQAGRAYTDAELRVHHRRFAAVTMRLFLKRKGYRPIRPDGTPDLDPWPVLWQAEDGTRLKTQIKPQRDGLPFTQNGQGIYAVTKEGGE
jgi:hypothetical protein